MGLDTTHNCWHGAYSQFGRFRRALMVASGMPPLETMVYFGGKTEWTPYKDHPLYPLLTHSDCDGELTPEECTKIAEGLDAIAHKLTNEHAEEARQFAAGCRDAAENHERVIFH